MSLIKREPSPAQSLASRANSALSTGPRTARGQANSGRSLRKPRPFAEVVANSLKALGECPDDFERRHEALSAAMQPRDAWESAWVQDIAILRWRLEHLQRAEAGVVALRRRRIQNRRLRAAAPPTGKAALELNQLTGLWGFTGIPDSPRKFQRVIQVLKQLRYQIRFERFDQDGHVCFSLLYGKAPAPHAALLQANFESVVKMYKEGHREAAQDDRKSLIAEVSKEIANYEQLQSLYAAEHLEADPLQEDAELLLPSQELDEVIRYETHLEDQIERKLRQFYARRREPVLRPPDSLPEAAGEPEAEELAVPPAPEEAKEEASLVRNS
jgi:hypothetical protein